MGTVTIRLGGGCMEDFVAESRIMGTVNRRLG